MTNNYIVAKFIPLYIPFDYSTPPYKEYVPPIPFDLIETAITSPKLEDRASMLPE